jgi:hypothetical protein
MSGMGKRHDKQWLFALTRAMPKPPQQTPNTNPSTPGPPPDSAAQSNSPSPVTWYESTLLWGALSAVVSLVSVYLGIALKDIRWFLVAAWPFCVLVAVGLVRVLRNRVGRLGIIFAVSIVSACGLWQVSRAVPPPNNQDIEKQFNAVLTNVLTKWWSGARKGVVDEITMNELTRPTHPLPQTVPPARNDANGHVRYLSEWQKTTLTAYLSRYRGQKILLLASGGPEAHSFANDLKAFFSSKSVGWKVEGPIPAPTDQRVMDLQITGNEDYFGKGAPAPFVALRDGLGFVGIQMRNGIVMEPGVDRDEVALWIGPESPGGQIEDIPPLSIECRYPAEYSEESTPVSPEIQSRAQYGRLVTIPNKKPFQIGDTLHVFFTDYVLYAGAKPADAVSIDVMGKVMRRNDDLKITVRKAFSGPVTVQVASDRDSKVKCVGIPR